MEDVNKILHAELEILQSDIISSMQAAGKRYADESVFSIHTNENEGYIEGPPEDENILYELKQWIRDKGIPVKDDATLDRLAKFLLWRNQKLADRVYKKAKITDLYAPAIRAFEKRIVTKTANYYTQMIDEML